MSTHHDANFPVTHSLSVGTEKFYADYVLLDCERAFRDQTVHYDQSTADRKISSKAIQSLQYLERLARNRTAPTNFHYLLIEATTIMSLAEIYLSEEAEKEIVRKTMVDFLRTVQERPMNDVDLRD